jgi:methyl-accepting chemotaxis protein
MCVILGAHVLYSLALAPWYETYAAFFLVGLPAGLIAMALTWLMPGRVVTRMTVAVVFMVLTALVIHQARGMIEMHFGFFVLFAVLLFYRDWRVYLAATLVAALHHISFNYFQELNYGVFCFAKTGWGVVALHVAYVAFTCGVLVYLSEQMRRSAMQAYATLRESQDVNRGLTRLTEGVRNSMGQISASVQQVTTGNNALSLRATQQASTLEQTAASMEQLTATVKQNAENARRANALVGGASEVAIKGGRVVHDVVQTMSGISESSKKISDIIGVIDGIAFQTNILALNAAVEAARAGEQGRGFAVVASEVRALAQRSATAAKEIKGLIGDSVSKVDAGGKQVEEAGKTMREIVDSVNGVTEIISQITAASQEQSSGIEQINQAVVQLEQATHQNAQVVEKASMAAESMRQQADHLLAMVTNSDAREAMQAAPARPTAAAPAMPAGPAIRKPVPQPLAGMAARQLPRSARATASTRDDGEWKEF